MEFRSGSLSIITRLSGALLAIWGSGFLISPVQALPTPAEDGFTQLSEVSNFDLSPSSHLDPNPLDQVTSVSQLSDVKPTDWAFQALQSLVERYGCIAGYPDRTFRGNRAIARYEFAAGVNACMDRIQELISGATSDLAKKDDLVTIQKLQEEFAAELATLRGRVDGLEAKVATLEKQQFSTTTKLSGQVIFGIQGRTQNDADFFPIDGVTDTPDPGDQINFIHNAQLSLLTQFSPKSLLLIGLQSGSGSTAPRLNNDVRLSYEGDTGSDLVLSDLTYRQLLGRNFAFVVGTEGVNAINVFRGANRVESAGFGPISAFAQRNPIIGIGAGRAGLGIDWQIQPRISLQAVYSAGGSPNSPANKAGLFNGPSSTGLQLTFAPTNTIDIAVNYINSYNPDGDLVNGIGDTRLTPSGEPIKTNAFGGTVSWRLSPRITLGGWAGFSTSKIPSQSGSVETFNWMAFLNFPDFGQRGNLLGLYVGQPPRITSSDLAPGLNVPDLLRGGLGLPGGQDKATTHVEAFYRMRLNDNIAITPGFMVIFNPANSDSDTIAVGAIRTTFTF
jgi:Carbohydrate-selective porin, OprB family/S-layer homology domain